MKRTILFLTIIATLTACDDKKSAEAPAPEGAAVQGDQPEAPAESAAQDKPAAAMPDDLQPGEQAFYGSKFTVIEPPMTLASAIEQAPEGTIKVEAKIQTVCKKKGCWFTMTGEGVTEDVRVRMKDYAFFVPKNADAAAAVVEGTLAQREVPQDEAQHYADDAAQAGEPAKKVEGPQKTWEFTATAIELRASES